MHTQHFAIWISDWEHWCRSGRGTQRATNHCLYRLWNHWCINATTDDNVLTMKNKVFYHSYIIYTLSLCGPRKRGTNQPRHRWHRLIYPVWYFSRAVFYEHYDLRPVVLDRVPYVLLVARICLSVRATPWPWNAKVTFISSGNADISNWISDISN